MAPGASSGLSYWWVTAGLWSYSLHRNRGPVEAGRRTIRALAASAVGDFGETPDRTGTPDTSHSPLDRRRQLGPLAFLGDQPQIGGGPELDSTEAQARTVRSERGGPLANLPTKPTNRRHGQGSPVPRSGFGPRSDGCLSSRGRFSQSAATKTGWWRMIRKGRPRRTAGLEWVRPRHQRL